MHSVSIDSTIHFSILKEKHTLLQPVDLSNGTTFSKPDLASSILTPGWKKCVCRIGFQFHFIETRWWSNQYSPPEQETLFPSCKHVALFRLQMFDNLVIHHCLEEFVVKGNPSLSRCNLISRSGALFFAISIASGEPSSPTLETPHLLCCFHEVPTTRPRSRIGPGFEYLTTLASRSE